MGAAWPAAPVVGLGRSLLIILASAQLVACGGGDGGQQACAGERNAIIVFLKPL